MIAIILIPAICRVHATLGHRIILGGLACGRIQYVVLRIIGIHKTVSPPHIIEILRHELSGISSPEVQFFQSEEFLRHSTVDCQHCQKNKCCDSLYLHLNLHHGYSPCKSFCSVHPDRHLCHRTYVGHHRPYGIRYDHRSVAYGPLLFPLGGTLWRDVGHHD